MMKVDLDFFHLYWGLEGIYHLSACDKSHLQATTSNEKRKTRQIQQETGTRMNKVYSLFMFVILHMLL